MTDIARTPVLETSDDVDPLVGHRVVQRTILRADQELDIRPAVRQWPVELQLR